jgi:uncharacterized protein
MAETLVSPGVLARENDQSFITQQPVQVGAAIVGPTVKGPVEQPTLVTSYSDYQNRFGTTFESGSNVYSYFTSIAAFNYFNNGGNTMLVTRVVSGSAGTQWTFATASVYTGDSYSTHGTLVTTVDGLAPGSFQNVTGSVGTYTVGLTGSLGNGGVATITLNTETTIDTITVTNPGNGWSIGEIITIPSASLNYGIGIAGTDTTFTLQAGNIDFYQSAVTFDAIDKGAVWNNSGSMLAGGALTSGSIDNVRLQVTTSNTASGTFSLVVRRGDDNATNPVVLESWTNMSLDPTQPNFVSRVIGDTTFNYNSGENYLEVSGSYPNASRYIKVKTVNLLTPNYLDNAGNAKSQYTGSIPGVGSGSIGGAFCAGTGSNISSYVGGGNYYDLAGTGVGAVTQGLVGSDYTNMLNLLSNQDDYAFNVLLTPGLFNSAHASQTTTAINNTQGRGDSIYVLDPITYAASISATTTQAASRNTSYAAMYWPWLQTIDPDSGQNVWVPASTMIGGVYAYNDSVSEPWFAPAGINRGGLGNVIRPERKLTQSNRDSLYENNVNPIASFPGTGTVVYGQKTLQRQASALDRVNVRRLLISLKGYIGQVAQNLVFEQNTAATRNNFLAAVNPYLESVQQRQGLYAFKVVMDDSNNTPDVIDRNQLVGAFYLQPTRTAEFIILDFNVLPTGATFPG